MDDLGEMVVFFNIFKETAANNIGFMHGFPNWVNKMSYNILSDTLAITIPPVLIKRGTADILAKSKRKKENDEFMKKKNYTYIEFVIKKSIDIYALSKKKTVSRMYKGGEK